VTRTLNPDNKVRQLVLSAFRADPTASLDQLVKICGYSRTTIYYHLSNLRNEGIIIRENRPRGQYVRGVQKPKAAKPQKKSSAGDAFRPNSSKPKKLDEQARIEMVVRMAKEKEAAGIMTDGVNIFQDHRVRRVLGRKTG
jgi:biotin operon repressor